MLLKVEINDEVFDELMKEALGKNSCPFDELDKGSQIEILIAYLDNLLSAWYELEELYVESVNVLNSCNDNTNH